MQKNFFDAIDTRKVVAAAASLKEFFNSRKDALLTEIRSKAALDKDLEAKLQTACEEWKTTFTA
jgi:F-type H+-transporting ATPase subunit alpha